MKPSDSDIEKSVVASVEQVLPSQFGVQVFGWGSVSKSEIPRTQSVHIAEVDLSGGDWKFLLTMFAEAQALNNFVKDLTGEPSVTDAEAAESVGEFSNIVGGLIRKDLNSKFAANLELKVPTLETNIQTADIFDSEESEPVFVFKTSLGDLCVWIETKLTHEKIQ